MEDISLYFPLLTQKQIDQFNSLKEIYGEWNSKINLISRKDFDQFNTRHLLHSLSIGKVCQFSAGAEIMDVGTGGGFPGIPLAIMFPECHFTLVDSIGKKIGVVKDVARVVKLDNVEAINARVESIDKRFDYIVSRAVTDMQSFLGWVKGKGVAGQRGSLPNGILYLKGGDLSQELAQARGKFTIYDISEMFKDPFFETKKVVYQQFL